MLDAIITHPLLIVFAVALNFTMLGVSLRKFVAELGESNTDANAILVAISIIGCMISSALLLMLLTA